MSQESFKKAYEPDCPLCDNASELIASEEYSDHERQVRRCLFCGHVFIATIRF